MSTSVFHKLYLSKTKEVERKIDYEKIITDNDFYTTYLTAVISTIKWTKGLPDGMPISLLEEMLQTCGQVAAFIDGDEKVILPAFGSGTLTRYGLFDKYMMFDATGKTYERSISEIELCFNNCLKTPYTLKINEFAKKTSYIYRAIQSSLQKAMQPNIWAVNDESDIGMIEDLNNERTQMKPNVAIPSDKFAGNKISRQSSFDNREIDLLAMWDVYTRQRNLFYTTFGFNNIEIQKKERLTEAEGSGNDEIVRYSLLNDMINQRRDFCERAKRLGFDLEFDICRDSATVYSLNESNEEKIETMKLESLKGINTSPITDREGGDSIENQNERHD